jgi:hypothetical protein
MAQNEQAASGRTDANGDATLTLRTIGGARWVIQQVSPDAPDVGAAAVGNIKKNGRLVAPFFASGDAVSQEPYVVLNPNDRLTVEWTGGEANALVNALFIYDDGLPG